MNPRHLNPGGLPVSLHRSLWKPVIQVLEMPAVFSAEEARRLQALHATGLLDSEPEQAFDELVQLAATLCGVPTSLITLVDETRQWFKARVGEPATHRPRENALCLYAMQRDDLYMVQDAQADPVLRVNPLVTGFPNIRFYAAYPLSTKEGFKLGTLCVLDTQPKTLSPIQQQALRVLAQQVMAQIELRGKLRELATAVQEKECIARELQISEERFRAFMDASPAAAFIKDEDGHIVYCNPAMTGRFGATPEEWHGKTDHQLWPKHYAEQFRQADVNVLEGDKVQHFDEHSPSPEGGTMSWSVYKFPFVDASGRRFLAGMALDVTEDRAAARELRRYQQELQEANRKLRALSLTDPLTGLRNRRGFEDHLESEFARARRSRAPLSLFMLDIDDFKKYNDTFGRVQGDEVLRRVAGLLQHYTRTGDLVARYGGEEFVAILPDTTEMEAAQIAERLCDAISTAPWHLRQVTVSIGVGNLHSLTLTPFDFVHSVDEALYAAKHNGKNQVCQAITKPDSRSVYILPTRKEGCLLGG